MAEQSQGIEKRSLLEAELAFRNAVDDFPRVYQNMSGHSMPLADYLGSNREAIATALLEHGALLFRDFAVPSIDDFQTALEAAGLHPSPDYPYGVSPRPHVKNAVFLSTQYTSVVVVGPHTEMAYLRTRPRWISFYCDLAPQRYGETPVFDMARVLEALPAELRDRFIGSDMRYVRYSGPTAGRIKLGRTIEETFGTSDRAEVERQCRLLDIDFSWMNDGVLRTETRLPAVTKHPETGRLSLNAQFVEPDSIIYGMREIRDRYPPLVRPLFEAYLRRLFRRDAVPYRSEIADGPPLTPAQRNAIARATYESATIFVWKPGDVLLIDNIRAGHGRLNVKGQRRILTALGDFYDIDEARQAA